MQCINFIQNNDVRTVVALNPSIKKKSKFDGVAHDALYDCLHQIKYLTDTLKTIKIIDK